MGISVGTAARGPVGRARQAGKRLHHCLSASSPGSCLGTGTQRLLKETYSLLYSSCYESPVPPFKLRPITPQKDTYHLYLLGTYTDTAGG